MPADFDISPLITPPAPTPAPAAPSPAPVVTPSPSEPVRTMPVMPKRSNKMLKWLIILAAGLVVITIASLWWGGNSFSDSGVIVTLEAPQQTKSGDEITYKITWRNTTSVPLSDMEFRLFYPEDTVVLVDGTPQNPETEGFTVDTLDPGKEGSREIKAFLVGDKGAIKTARLHLLYKAGNFRSEFEKEATVGTTITDLPIALTLTAPPTTVAGQPIQYILDIRNDSGEDMTDLRVQITYPDGFTVQQMQPQPTSGNTTWAIARLDAGDGTRIRIDGVLSGNERETKTIKVVLQRNLNGTFTDSVRSEAFTVIGSPLLSVTVSPERGRDYVSFVGDQLKYIVTYKNNSRFTLLGTILTVKLEGAMYDMSKVQTNEGSFSDATGTIRYDSSGIPAFAALPPGASGRITFMAPLKSSATGSGGASNFFVKATARFSTTNVPSGVDGNEVFATDSVVTKIGTQPGMTQSVQYDGGAGSGPMPPQVGQDTVLTIRWQITNPGNDVRTTRVIGTLAPGVSFVSAGSATLGSAPSYDPASGRVTWTLGTLPFGTGNGTAPAEATFRISIRPSTNQVGRSVPLVHGTVLTGTDVFTNQAIEVNVKDVTTDNVEGHTGEGEVE